LREWPDPKVYRIMNGKRRWVTSPTELSKQGGFPTVRLVPDGALNAIPVGDPLPSPDPGVCDVLRKQVADLDTLIATLKKQLENLDDPHREAAIQQEISTSENQRARLNRGPPFWGAHDHRLGTPDACRGDDLAN
jgi:hypothetical protein